jgi:hypothetical protein
MSGIVHPSAAGYLKQEEEHYFPAIKPYLEEHGILNN